MKTTRGKFWVFFIAGFILTGIFISLRKSSEDKDTAPQAKAFPQATSATETNAFMTENLHEKREALKAKREIEKVEYEKDEAERLANWKANFPFQPTYHPTLRYDPSGYNVNDGIPATNEELMLTGCIVKRHGFLKAFYENPLRHSRQFQQLHSILDEYDRAYNPEVVGGIFQNALDYQRARQWAPDLLWHTYDLTRGEYNPRTGDFDYPMEPLDGKTTWGKVAEDCEESILATLTWPRLWPENEPASEEEAQEITNRLLTEIRGMETLEGMMVSYDPEHEAALQEGDQMLIPYEGWLEDYRAYQKKTYNWEPPPGHP